MTKAAEKIRHEDELSPFFDAVSIHGGVTRQAQGLPPDIARR